jgi:hypothetical protein
MDENGNYKEPAASQSFLAKAKKSVLAHFNSEKKENTVGDLILSELESVEAAIRAEKEFFTKERLTERETIVISLSERFNARDQWNDFGIKGSKRYFGDQWQLENGKNGFLGFF